MDWEAWFYYGVFYGMGIMAGIVSLAAMISF